MNGAALMSASGERLLDVAHELYGLRPGEFIGARNERARQIRADGDRELARAVTALRKPSVAAWTVNMIVRHMAERVEDLLELGAQLRAAQDDLDVSQLRELNKQQRQLTAAVAREGERAAADLGQNLSASAVGQVSATLHAAMTDEDAAAALRTGLLVEGMTGTGLTPVELTGIVAVPEALGDRSPRQRPPSQTVPLRSSRAAKQRREAEEQAKRELAEAEAEAEVAEASAEAAREKARSAAERVQELQARTLQIRAEIEELRRRLDEREFLLEEVDDDLDRAVRDEHDARADETETTAALEEAQGEVERQREHLPTVGR